MLSKKGGNGDNESETQWGFIYPDLRTDQSRESWKVVTSPNDMSGLVFNDCKPFFLFLRFFDH